MNWILLLKHLSSNKPIIFYLYYSSSYRLKSFFYLLLTGHSMRSHSVLILTYSFKNALVPNTTDLFKVFFMSVCMHAVVYIYIFFYSSFFYPIGMYKVYYSILISFIIKSIRLPLFLFFFSSFLFSFFENVSMNKKRIYSVTSKIKKSRHA